MSTSTALRHFRRALAQWPPDTLRPDVAFSPIILVRKEKQLTQPKEYQNVRSSIDACVSTEIEQANALFSLLENRYTIKYKLTKKLLEPRSAPTYYADLLKEIEEAPKRSWVSQRLNKWKGFLRFS